MVSFVPRTSNNLWETSVVMFDRERTLDIRALKHLRLVNKMFERAASPYLFQTMYARSRENLTSLAALSRSRCACHVRSLFVCWHDQLDYSKSMEMILPSAANQLLGLRKLTIDAPLASGESFSPRTHLQLTDAVCNTLQQRQCKELESLALKLPSTGCLARIAKTATILSHENEQSSLSVLMTKLRNLNVTIIPPHVAFGRYPDRGEDPTKDPTSTQHIDGLFQFVDMAPNLEFFSILGQCQEISLGPLDIPYHQHLRAIRVCTTTMSAHELYRLFQQSKHTLTLVRLDFMRLTTGNWEELLVNMRSLSNLISFSMCGCQYHDSDSFQSGAFITRDQIAFCALQSQIAERKLRSSEGGI